MKELERFLIIGWVVGEELVSKNSVKKQASSILILDHQGEIEAVGLKGRIPGKKRKFNIFKLVKVKRHLLRVNQNLLLRKDSISSGTAFFVITIIILIKQKP